MTAPNPFATARLDDLFEEYVELIEQCGSIIRGTYPPDRSPDYQIAFQRQKAIAAEIVARGPSSRIRAMFDHPSADVRGEAGWQFRKADPEWGRATWHALDHNMSTASMVEKLRAAQRRPPRALAVKSMTTAQLHARFEDASDRFFFAQYVNDDGSLNTELRNRIYDEAWDAFRELERRDELDVLLTCFDSDNPSMLLHMAIWSGRRYEDKSLAALKKIANGLVCVEWWQARAILRRDHDWEPDAPKGGLFSPPVGRSWREKVY